MKITALSLFLLPLLVVSSLAVIPDSDVFDSAPFTIGTDFSSGLDTWKSDTATVEVSGDAGKFQGTSSVNVNSGTVSNNVDSSGPSGVVWTEFHLIPQLGVAPVAAATNEANHMHYYATNGLLTVWTLSGWVEVDEDIHGNALSAVSTSAFHRLSIYQNFTTSISAVLLDGAVVLQDVDFPGSSTGYETFSVQNVESGPAYLDTYSVSLTVPASSDLNGNGTADAEELDSNGYVARIFTVGETAAEDFASLSAASAVVRDGDVLLVTNVTGTLEGGGAVVFNANVTIRGEDFTTDHAVTVSLGSTVTVENVAMDIDDSATINGTLVVDGAGDSMTSSDLTMGASGAIDSNGGTWATDSPVVSLTGTFDIGGSAYSDADYESSLNFADNFEDYDAGTVVSGLGFRGWGASSGASVIQSSKVQQGSRAATISGLVSNRVNGTILQTKVWTDFQLCAAQGAEPSSPDTATSSALFYMTTNGFLSVYTGASFVEQTTNASGGAVSPVGTNTWTRISVFTDYSTDKAAIFMGDQLLIEQVDFPSGGAANYSQFGIESADNDANIDDFEITQLVPADLVGDVDGDGRHDADEIQLHGTLDKLGPLWTVFKFN